MFSIAGAGAYVFAKRSVNADRAARHEATTKRKEAALRDEKKAMPQQVKPPIPVPQTPSASSTHKTRTPTSEYGGGIANASPHAQPSQNGGHMSDDVGHPSQEGARDPAPTRHEPDTEAQRVAEKGKYEAAEPYRSRKGNRFS